MQQKAVMKEKLRTKGFCFTHCSCSVATSQSHRGQRRLFIMFPSLFCPNSQQGNAFNLRTNKTFELKPENIFKLHVLQVEILLKQEKEMFVYTIRYHQV